MPAVVSNLLLLGLLLRLGGDRATQLAVMATAIRACPSATAADGAMAAAGVVAVIGAAAATGVAKA